MERTRGIAAVVGRVGCDLVTDANQAAGDYLAAQSAFVKQAPQDGAMRPARKEGTGFAKLNGFYFHGTDVEFKAEEGIEIDSFGDDIAAGVFGGKFEAGGPDEGIDFLGLDEGQVFAR